MVIVNSTSLMLASTLGWVGAIGTVGAYALVSQRKLDAHSTRFQAINVLGAGLLAISAVTHGSWPSAASNVVWMFFGAQALVSARDICRAGVTRHWHAARRHLGVNDRAIVHRS